MCPMSTTAEHFNKLKTRMEFEMKPFADAQNTDDLHDLMAVAVLCGHRGVESDVAAIYEAWAKSYPDDALGGIGRGLAMIGNGQVRDGYRLIEETARTASTRNDQARDVLASLKRDIQAIVD